MVVILKRDPDKAQVESLMHWLESKGIDVHTTVGKNQTILGLVGDTIHHVLNSFSKVIQNPSLPSF